MGEIEKIVIVGAGGLGREVLATVRACNLAYNVWEVLGFLDCNPRLAGTTIADVPVLGGDEWCQDNKSESLRFICAIGNCRSRRRVAENLTTIGCRFATIVHPDVFLPPTVQIGQGSIVMAGTRFTTDAQIGSHVIIYLNCSITHDVRVADYCMVASGSSLSGACVLEEGVELGTGVCVLPTKRLGAWSVIGAGSVIVRDIPPNVTAAGVPCRIIKQIENQEG